MRIPNSSPLWATVPAAVALAAAGARWIAQGAGNVYTDLGRRLYVPDPVLGGWRISDDAPLFLGLEVIAGLAALTVGIAVAGWLLARLERRRGRRYVVPRGALWAGGVVALVVPLAAFASGLGPADGRAQLPRGVAIAAPTAIEAGVGFDAPAGRWQVAPHPRSVVVASIAAGGERFDGRFARPIGEWRGDPGDLRQPMAARVSVEAKTMDTGIDPRSEHAVELLAAAAHPTIELSLTGLDGARADGAGIAFAARGALTVMGTPIDVPITGTLRPADAAAEKALGVGPALLLSADTALDLRQTPLAAKVKSFDDPRVDIHVDLVLVRVNPT